VAAIELAMARGQAPATFRVEVVRSPAGEAAGVISLDVEPLLARREELERTVLASAVASRAVLAQIERPIREIGQVLFSALLGSGDVAGRYRASAALAAERGEGLRVVLRLEDPALAGLPWEAMYDGAAGAYVCRRDQLVRHVPVASTLPPLEVKPPLQILGVVSSPRGLVALDVEKEQEQLDRALARPRSDGLVNVHWAPEATWATLQDLLLGREWHVVHFIGHGDFDIDRDEGLLALTRDDGRTDLVGAGRLVDLLREARPMPRLVVLNSCLGAATGVNDLFAGTAAALVRGGVSAVAAMQYSISDEAAVAFARGFYTAIAHGRGVDEATSSGRRAILGTGAQTLEWVTPVMYLRGQDSHLFTMPAEPVPPPPTPLPVPPKDTADGDPPGPSGPADRTREPEQGGPMTVSTSNRSPEASSRHASVGPKVASTIRRMKSAPGASRNISEAAAGLGALGYVLTPAMTPGKRLQPSLRISRRGLFGRTIGFLTPGSFIFLGVVDQPRLLRLAGATLTPEGVAFSHEQGVEQGLEAARILRK